MIPKPPMFLVDERKAGRQTFMALLLLFSLHSMCDLASESSALGGGVWWGTFGSMRRGRFFHHKIHIKHQDLAQKDGRYNMVMLITREMDE